MERLAPDRDGVTAGRGLEPDRRLRGRDGRARVVGARRRGSAAGARRQRLGAESRTCRGERRTRRGGGGRARARVGDGRAPAGGAGRRRGAADHLPRDVLEVPRRDQDECRRRRLPVRLRRSLERQGPGSRARHRAPPRVARRRAGLRRGNRGQGPRGSSRAPRDSARGSLPPARGRARRGVRHRAAVEPCALAADRVDGGGSDARPGGLLRRRGQAPRRALARSGAQPEASRRPVLARRGPRAPRLRPRAAPGARDRRAGQAALGGAPSVRAPTGAFPRDERALPAHPVERELRGADGVPRSFVPECRRLVRPVRTAPAGVGDSGRAAG